MGTRQLPLAQRVSESSGERAPRAGEAEAAIDGIRVPGLLRDVYRDQLWCGSAEWPMRERSMAGGFLHVFRGGGGQTQPG